MVICPAWCGPRRRTKRRASHTPTKAAALGLPLGVALGDVLHPALVEAPAPCTAGPASTACIPEDTDASELLRSGRVDLIPVGLSAEQRDPQFLYSEPFMFADQLLVQPEGAAPVTACFRSGEPLRPVEPHTLADSIAVGVPRNWKKAVLAVEESGGTMINVSDAEILEAMRYTGRLAGIFAEPAAATAVAGLRRAAQEGAVGRKASAVAIITGNGLKDVQSAKTAVGEPFEIPPDGTGLDEILGQQELATPCQSVPC